MQTDGLISSILTVFFLYFLPNAHPYTGLTGPCCLPSACRVWHQSMNFLLEISPVGDTIDYSLWRSCHKDSLSLHRSNQFNILFSSLSVIYSYLWSQSVLTFQIAKKKQICCSIVSFGSSPKIVLFHAEAILGLWVTQKERLNQDWAVVRCLFC